MNLKLFATVAAAAIGLGCAGSAAAGVVLTDTFETPGGSVLNWPGDGVLNSVPAPGNVNGLPSVDLVELPDYGGLCGTVGNHCVDLDGSTGGTTPAGELASFASFGAGSYTLDFDLGGNFRGAPGKSTTISIGNFTTTIGPLASGQALTPYHLAFTTTGGKLDFLEVGPGDQQGNLLDNVVLTAVPEPATWALMLMGFGILGAGLRRRNATSAAVA